MFSHLFWSSRVTPAYDLKNCISAAACFLLELSVSVQVFAPYVSTGTSLFCKIIQFLIGYLSFPFIRHLLIVPHCIGI
jgi:hypothetical protein